MTTGSPPLVELRKWYRVGKLYGGFIPRVGKWKRVYSEHGSSVTIFPDYRIIKGVRTHYILYNIHVDKVKHDEKLG